MTGWCWLASWVAASACVTYVYVLIRTLMNRRK